LTAARSTDAADVTTQALADQIVKWNTESRAALRATYGAKDGEALLLRVERFVRERPALSKMLGQHGLGSQPDIIAGLAAHVRSTGYTGQ
jgi:hypothetical protein